MNFSKPLLLLVFILTGFGTLNAQEEDSLLQRRIRSQQYVFVPQSASSPSMFQPLVNEEYKVRVTADSVVSDLPYNGVHFSRSTPEQETKFISTRFKYKAVEKKKGRWEINIDTKDARGARVLLLIYSDGTADMNVTSPGNETMVYKGYVY
jgi:hypothetical protein